MIQAFALGLPCQAFPRPGPAQPRLPRGCRMEDFWCAGDTGSSFPGLRKITLASSERRGYTHRRKRNGMKVLPFPNVGQVICMARNRWSRLLPCVGKIGLFFFPARCAPVGAARRFLVSHSRMSAPLCVDTTAISFEGFHFFNLGGSQRHLQSAFPAQNLFCDCVERKHKASAFYFLKQRNYRLLANRWISLSMREKSERGAEDKITQHSLKNQSTVTRRDEGA